MPRTVDPARWERFFDLYRKGYPRYLAAREAGISRDAVHSFFDGDESSSGRKYLQQKATAEAELKRLEADALRTVGA